MPTGLSHYLVVLLVSGVALWRAPALRWGDRQRRALCGCFAGYTAALWPKTPIVEDWLSSHIPITDVAVLLNAYASSAAAVYIIIYAAAGYGQTNISAQRPIALTHRIARIAPYAAAVGVIMMTIIFFAGVDRRYRTTDFVVEHVGQPGAATFMTISYILMGTSCLICGYQWSSVARLAPSRLLRIGLAVLAISMVVASAYIVIRTIYMWGTIAFPAFRPYGQVIEHVSAGMYMVIFFAFAVGSSIPTGDAAASCWTTSRLLSDLKPLHDDLVAAFPDVPFERSLRRHSTLASVPVLRKFFDWSIPVDVRLGFRIHGIADAVEQLRHYAPPELFDFAEDYAATMEEELPEEERPNLQVVAEAVYIKAALVAFELGERRTRPSETLPRKPLVSTEAEARWWRQVQEQYASVTQEQAASVFLAASAAV